MGLVATDEHDEPQEPGTHDIYLAIKEAMERIGFNEEYGGDNVLGIGTTYVFDATGKRFEITIRSEN